MRLCCGLSITENRSHLIRRRLHRYLALTSVLLLTFNAASSAHAHKATDLELGWDGDVQFGALATFGETDTSAVSANTVFSYKGISWEHEIDARYYYSASEVLTPRLDSDGEVMRDAQNKEITDMSRSTTSNRRYLSAETRFFFAPHYYTFVAANVDKDTPADLDIEKRQVAGGGYKLYRSKKDYISAEIGAGNRRRVEFSEGSDQEAIGYFGLRVKRKLAGTLSFYFDLDSDFGSDDRYTEIETSLSWKLRDPVSIKLKYEARFNSTFFDPINTYDTGLQAAFTVNLAVDVF